MGILGFKTREDLRFNVALRGKLENQEFKGVTWAMELKSPPDSQTACQDGALVKGFNMKNKLKPRIRPIDYHLECCIEAIFWKMVSTEEVATLGTVTFC